MVQKYYLDVNNYADSSATIYVIHDEGDAPKDAYCDYNGAPYCEDDPADHRAYTKGVRIA